MSMSLLARIRGPADLKRLRRDQLPALAQEIRERLIQSCSVTGGHIGASLGVVELSIAILAEFDSPTDKIVWDVGHQCYPHKILTGRRDRIRTLRQGGGLSGFTKRSESEYDPFGAAHAATSISSALGFARARDHLVARLLGYRVSFLYVVEGRRTAELDDEALLFVCLPADRYFLNTLFEVRR